MLMPDSARQEPSVGCEIPSDIQIPAVHPHMRPESEVEGERDVPMLEQPSQQFLEGQPTTTAQEAAMEPQVLPAAEESAIDRTVQEPSVGLSTEQRTEVPTEDDWPITTPKKTKKGKKEKKDKRQSAPLDWIDEPESKSSEIPEEVPDKPLQQPPESAGILETKEINDEFTPTPQPLAIPHDIAERPLREDYQPDIAPEVVEPPLPEANLPSTLDEVREQSTQGGIARGEPAPQREVVQETPRKPEEDNLWAPPSRKASKNGKKWKNAKDAPSLDLHEDPSTPSASEPELPIKPSMSLQSTEPIPIPENIPEPAINKDIQTDEPVVPWSSLSKKSKKDKKKGKKSKPASGAATPIAEKDAEMLEESPLGKDIAEVPSVAQLEESQVQTISPDIKIPEDERPGEIHVPSYEDELPISIEDEPTHPTLPQDIPAPSEQVEEPERSPAEDSKFPLSWSESKKRGKKDKKNKKSRNGGDDAILEDAPESTILLRPDLDQAMSILEEREPEKLKIQSEAEQLPRISQDDEVKLMRSVSPPQSPLLGGKHEHLGSQFEREILTSSVEDAETKPQHSTSTSRSPVLMQQPYKLEAEAQTESLPTHGQAVIVESRRVASPPRPPALEPMQDLQQAESENVLALSTQSQATASLVPDELPPPSSPAFDKGVFHDLPTQTPEPADVPRDVQVPSHQTDSPATPLSPSTKALQDDIADFKQRLEVLDEALQTADELSASQPSSIFDPVSKLGKKDKKGKKAKGSAFHWPEPTTPGVEAVNVLKAEERVQEEESTLVEVPARKLSKKNKKAKAAALSWDEENAPVLETQEPIIEEPEVVDTPEIPSETQDIQTEGTSDFATPTRKLSKKDKKKAKPASLTWDEPQEERIPVSEMKEPIAHEPEVFKNLDIPSEIQASQAEETSGFSTPTRKLSKNDREKAAKAMAFEFAEQSTIDNEPMPLLETQENHQKEVDSVLSEAQITLQDETRPKLEPTIIPEVQEPVMDEGPTLSRKRSKKDKKSKGVVIWEEPVPDPPKTPTLSDQSLGRTEVEPLPTEPQGIVTAERPTVSRKLSKKDKRKAKQTSLSWDEPATSSSDLVNLPESQEMLDAGKDESELTLVAQASDMPQDKASGFSTPTRKLTKKDKKKAKTVATSLEESAELRSQPSSIPDVQESVKKQESSFGGEEEGVTHRKDFPQDIISNLGDAQELPPPNEQHVETLILEQQMEASLASHPFQAPTEQQIEGPLLEPQAKTPKSEWEIETPSEPQIEIPSATAVAKPKEPAKEPELDVPKTAMEDELVVTPALTRKQSKKDKKKKGKAAATFDWTEDAPGLEEPIAISEPQASVDQDALVDDFAPVSSKKGKKKGKTAAFNRTVPAPALEEPPTVSEPQASVDPNALVDDLSPVSSKKDKKGKAAAFDQTEQAPALEEPTAISDPQASVDRDALVDDFAPVSSKKDKKKGKTAAFNRTELAPALEEPPTVSEPQASVDRNALVDDLAPVSSKKDKKDKAATLDWTEDAPALEEPTTISKPQASSVDRDSLVDDFTPVSSKKDKKGKSTASNQTEPAPALEEPATVSEPHVSLDQDALVDDSASALNKKEKKNSKKRASGFGWTTAEERESASVPEPQTTQTKPPQLNAEQPTVGVVPVISETQEQIQDIPVVNAPVSGPLPGKMQSEEAVESNIPQTDVAPIVPISLLKIEDPSMHVLTDQPKLEPEFKFTPKTNKKEKRKSKRATAAFEESLEAVGSHTLAGSANPIIEQPAPFQAAPTDQLAKKDVSTLLAEPEILTPANEASDIAFPTKKSKKEKRKSKKGNVAIEEFAQPAELLDEQEYIEQSVRDIHTPTLSTEARETVDIDTSKALNTKEHIVPSTSVEVTQPPCPEPEISSFSPIDAKPAKRRGMIGKLAAMFEQDTLAEQERPPIVRPWSRASKKEAKIETTTPESAPETVLVPQTEAPARASGATLIRNLEEESPPHHVLERMELGGQSKAVPVEEPIINHDLPEELAAHVVPEEMDLGKEIKEEVIVKDIAPHPFTVPRASSPDKTTDFSAAVMAGLAESGFNTDLVLKDPSFHRSTSPPGTRDISPEEDIAIARKEASKSKLGDLGRTSPIPVSPKSQPVTEVPAEVPHTEVATASTHNPSFDPIDVVNDPFFSRRKTPPGVLEEGDPEELWMSSKKVKKGKRKRASAPITPVESGIPGAEQAGMIPMELEDKVETDGKRFIEPSADLGTVSAEPDHQVEPIVLSGEKGLRETIAEPIATALVKPPKTTHDTPVATTFTEQQAHAESAGPVSFEQPTFEPVESSDATPIEEEPEPPLTTSKKKGKKAKKDKKRASLAQDNIETSIVDDPVVEVQAVLPLAVETPADLNGRDMQSEKPALASTFESKSRALPEHGDLADTLGDKSSFDVAHNANVHLHEDQPKPTFDESKIQSNVIEPVLPHEVNEKPLEEQVLTPSAEPETIGDIWDEQSRKKGKKGKGKSKRSSTPERPFEPKTLSGAVTPRADVTNLTREIETDVVEDDQPLETDDWTSSKKKGKKGKKGKSGSTALLATSATALGSIALGKSDSIKQTQEDRGAMINEALEPMGSGAYEPPSMFDEGQKYLDEVKGSDYPLLEVATKKVDLLPVEQLETVRDDMMDQTGEWALPSKKDGKKGKRGADNVEQESRKFKEPGIEQLGKTAGEDTFGGEGFEQGLSTHDETIEQSRERVTEVAHVDVPDPLVDPHKGNTIHSEVSTHELRDSMGKNISPPRQPTGLFPSVECIKRRVPSPEGQPEEKRVHLSEPAPKKSEVSVEMPQAEYELAPIRQAPDPVIRGVPDIEPPYQTTDKSIAEASTVPTSSRDRSPIIEPTWSFGGVRDSAVHVSDSPLLSAGSRFESNARDSGYHDAGYSPSMPQGSSEPVKELHYEGKTKDTQDRKSDYSIVERTIHEDPGVEPRSRSPSLPEPSSFIGSITSPSAVDSATKERTSYLFNSSPSTRGYVESPLAAVKARQHDIVPEASPLKHPKDVKDNSKHVKDSQAKSHKESEESRHSTARSRSKDRSSPTRQTPIREPPPSIFGDPRERQSEKSATYSTPRHMKSPNPQLDTIKESSPDDSPLHKKGRPISDVGAPERGVKSARRSESPKPFSERLKSPPPVTPTPSSRKPSSRKPIPPTLETSPADTPSKDTPWHQVHEGVDRSMALSPARRLRSPAVTDPTKQRMGEQRSPSVLSDRSTGGVARHKTPDHFQALSPASNRSATPPLRRVDRSLSGDLRSRASLGEVQARDTKNAQPDLTDIAIAAGATAAIAAIASSSKYDPVRHKGKGRADMSDVYEAWGEAQGSPMSPTRPPSVRKRQSMQIMDLTTQLEQLAAQNRSLEEAKAKAEESMQAAQYQQDVDNQVIQETIQARDQEIHQKDIDIAQLRDTLRTLQGEVTRLTQLNNTLTEANHNLTNDTNERYAQLQSEGQQVHQQWQQSTRELEDLRTQHNQLTSGMQDALRAEIGLAIDERNAEIERLKTELATATDKIKTLQRQIQASKQGDSFLVVRDEDYFDSACQQLCQHVQQWVLRFSKLSDSRACRLSSDVARDHKLDSATREKIETRLDNAILDGSDVDMLLADRVKRRDVFMSVVMTMIWEYVFTRYLFGMDREQRQKLKSLEKTLSEVGPTRAVAQWRAITLTLLSKRDPFIQQRKQDTEAVVQEIYSTLSTLLPPASHLQKQIQESLRNVMRLAVELSIEMRTQRAEYIMLPPLQPEYDTNGDLIAKVTFNASLMNERSGETSSNDQLEARGAVVKIVLFPLVVKKGDDFGEGEDEIVVCPAQVLVARATNKKVVRVLSGAMSIDSRQRSVMSLAPESSVMDLDGGNMI
ncbi:uncharacterized protein BDR25DRAFT_7658 [Lindgomyces ingoldianus]|uniref:Uncharacterized protein n=1 Tax=Lindgomyces ingoldianus TaxID=673940 RepID=A0ACB6RHT6_9PLEO|nr:uncharacterized protein BDR25DRAFT_7658 [Lindgomyces ingoldianus]KAF2478077.1 hypothetical protein BDR25DRAFT_7658 [Lindgomyces ingoldianus]